MRPRLTYEQVEEMVRRYATEPAKVLGEEYGLAVVTVRRWARAVEEANSPAPESPQMSGGPQASATQGRRKES